MPPKYRTDPDAYREVVAARVAEYREGKVSENVFKANLKVLGFTQTERDATATEINEELRLLKFAQK